jgi:hypothetical protein
VEKMKKDPRGVFDLCERVCKEAVDSLERLQKAYQTSLQQQLEESEQAFEEAVAYRDIALKERDSAI